MIKQSILLLNDIFASFDWLDRYGLLASPVTRNFPLKDGTTIKETLPAATIASGVECNEKNLYYLVPDERWKSLAYWELINDYKIDRYDDIPDNQGIKITFDARLVLWYNANALGFSRTEGLNDKLFFSLFTHLDGLRFNNPINMSAVNITYDMTRVIEDKKKIFGRYSYRESHDWLFAPPNGYMAADFRITIITTRNCLPVLHQGNDSVCNTRESLTWDMAFPDVTTDNYQRWISTQEGQEQFTVTDFVIPDLSGLSVEEIDELFLVFADGAQIHYTSDTVTQDTYQYSIITPDQLILGSGEGSAVEMYLL